jgi:hypothetical protein
MRIVFIRGYSSFVVIVRHYSCGIVFVRLQSISASGILLLKCAFHHIAHLNWLRWLKH